jgi:hypothetical protein
MIWMVVGSNNRVVVCCSILGGIIVIVPLSLLLVIDAVVPLNDQPFPFSLSFSICNNSAVRRRIHVYIDEEEMAIRSGLTSPRECLFFSTECLLPENWQSLLNLMKTN